jgi:hypothetical protein
MFLLSIYFLKENPCIQVFPLLNQQVRPVFLYLGKLYRHRRILNVGFAQIFIFLVRSGSAAIYVRKFFLSFKSLQEFSVSGPRSAPLGLNRQNPALGSRSAPSFEHE